MSGDAEKEIYLSAMRGLVGFICALLLLTACSKPEETPAPVPPPSTPTSMAPPPKIMTPKIMTVIGDSDTTGTGGNTWPSLMSVRLRQDGIVTGAKVAAEGGAGYITPSSRGLMFGELAARSVQPYDDLVIYFGSTNDGFPDGLNVQAATAAVNDTFAKTRATAPTAKLLVIGPAKPDPAPFTVELNDILRDQAARVGATFVDALGEKWLQDDPALVGPDRVHPSDAGQRYLADKIEPLVTAQLR